MNIITSDIHEIKDQITEFSNNFLDKRIIITGARGFLGRYFIETFNLLNEKLLVKPVKIIALDNLITSGKSGVNYPEYKNVEFIKHNVIENFETSESVDYIIHAAGIASPFYYRAFPLETLDVAITGTKNMLNLAKNKNAKFIFFSSSEIYGDPDPKDVPTTESYRGNVSSQGPRSCYDESKRVGETLCYIFNTLYGVHTNIIRPFNVYGPGMQETDYRVLPNFASQIIKGKPLNLYGSGKQTRTFCYITDAIEGFLRVVSKGMPGETYNIGNSQPETSMLELVQKIEKIYKKSIPFNLVDYPDSYPADEPNRRAPDISKAFNQLGYNPKVSLEEGLNKFFKWAEKNYHN